jgi:CubicO group peptidase (beta-lactamase class C family)
LIGTAALAQETPPKATASTPRPTDPVVAGLWEIADDAERDAHITCDPHGMPFAAGGLCTTLRDLARMGEMMRCDGALNGRQIMPASAVAAIRQGGSPERFAKAGYAQLPGWSYRHQWWHSHNGNGNGNGMFMARGVHGQAIVIDPAAEMVVARYASHPLAANANLDPTSLPAWEALARWLMRHSA